MAVHQVSPLPLALFLLRHPLTHMVGPTRHRVSVLVHAADAHLVEGTETGERQSRGLRAREHAREKRANKHTKAWAPSYVRTATSADVLPCARVCECVFVQS